MALVEKVPIKIGRFDWLYTKEKKFMLRKVYVTEEERKQARRDNAAKIRRLKGIPEKRKFNSEEEKIQAKKEAHKRHNLLHKDKIRQRSKDWEMNNHDKKINQRRNWRSLNRNSIKENHKKWRDANIDKIRKNYEKHKSKIIQKCKEYIKKHPDIKRKASQNWKAKNKNFDSIYYLKNKDKILSRSKGWYSSNVMSRKVYNINYRKSNKEKCIEVRNRRREKSKSLYENF